VPGTSVVDVVTTPVAELIDIPVTCELSEVFLMEKFLAPDPFDEVKVIEPMVP
jgi:hypothetical protein